MILKRRNDPNIHDLESSYGDLIPSINGTDPMALFTHYMKMRQSYNAAMSEVSTKLEILDEEFQVHHERNPIHHIECRLKSPRSCIEKLSRRGLPLSIESMGENLYDIAGIRVICNYIEDVYTVEKLLVQQADIEQILRKDYIAAPKDNGYRSLHLVLTVPVFLSEGTQTIPVEIQLRTIAMDYWASLEHHLRYKNNDQDVEEYQAPLRDCAKRLAEIEADMQEIFSKIR